MKNWRSFDKDEWNADFTASGSVDLRIAKLRTILNSEKQRLEEREKRRKERESKKKHWLWKLKKTKNNIVLKFRKSFQIFIKIWMNRFCYLQHFFRLKRDECVNDSKETADSLTDCNFISISNNNNNK